MKDDKYLAALEVLIMDGNSVCDRAGFDKYAIDNLGSLRILNWMYITQEMRDVGWEPSKKDLEQRKKVIMSVNKKEEFQPHMSEFENRINKIQK